MKILVTGAAGFLGTVTVKRARAAGHDVRAMVRNPSSANHLALPADSIIAADMTRPETFPPAVAGVDAVIHCAATTSQSAPKEPLSRRVNVEGTRLLYEAARAAGVARWVQISSMSAHPAMPSVYGRTKLAADNYLRAQSGPPAWTILRPSLIYGPGERGLVAKTIKILEKLPVAPVIGSGNQLIRPVYVDDVADAALACLAVPGSAGKTYMLGGADEVTLNAFMQALVRARGLRRPLLHLPIPLALLLARTMGLFMANPPISTDNVLGVRTAQPVDSAPAERDLDWHPMPLNEGLRRTFTPTHSCSCS